MSRVGKDPVKIPSGVSVEVTANEITAKGPKGELSIAYPEMIAVSQEDDAVILTRTSDTPEARAQHGLVRTLLSNITTGVSEGFSKQLEFNGVGYKVDVSGDTMTLNLGYSHPHTVKLPEGISATVEGSIITISGIDKQHVGQIAANIRSLRPPEPYKGKGIKYIDERIIRKAGKTTGAK